MSADYGERRCRMVELIRARGVRNTLVLEAMEKVERHRFIPEEILCGGDPYGDYPCSIGYGQTVSQPYIVALMLDMLGPAPGDRVLEIGTGCGYQTQILFEMGMRVCTIEIIPELYRFSGELVDPGIERKLGNGYLGWPEMAPFSGIVVSCAPESVPEALVEQLATGGRMVLPVGTLFQRLEVIEKTGDGYRERAGLPVRFVPMTGEPHREER